MTAEYKVIDGVAIITMDNPPVNSLSYSTRLGIARGLDLAQSDTAVKAIVLTGAGRAFSGGADMREFNDPAAVKEPSVWTIIDALEASEKPVVAAIHSIAMGGGLELALGCHYRVCAPGAQIALSEVRMGLLPGAGGTQRLPRAIGLEAAMNMIVSGASVPGESLAAAGLFDRVIDSDLLQGALGFARDMATRAGPYPRIRDRKVKHDNVDGFVEFTRAAVLAHAKNYPAPHRCVEAVAAAAKKKFDQGIAVERRFFHELLDDSVSKSLRHRFFSERAAAKISDVPDDTPAREIKTVAVVGAGTMGGGIAMSFLNAGFPVTLFDISAAALEKGMETIRRNYQASVKKGKRELADVDRRLALLTPALSYSELANCDLVIEAVYEEMAIKVETFKKLDAIMKEGAILASNTSTLDVNKIAAATRRPQDVVGLHFFSPANVMRLLEVVRAEHTGKDVLVTVMKIAKKIGKLAVVSGVCDGFIGNRMLDKYIRQANFMVEQGALPEEIDKAIENFGFAMGPFRMSDLAGNDIGWAIRQRKYEENPDTPRHDIADRLCEMGRFGQKTGAGWYDYETGKRKPMLAPTVRKVIDEYWQSKGVTPRSFSEKEITERLIYALVNEGAAVLEEGIASKASDIDMVYLTGYGFPEWRGGPMFYANSVGLYNVRRTMLGFQKTDDTWKPAALIEELAADGRGFI